MGFRSLQHLQNRRSTGRGFASPASFRLQGLFTLLTAFSLRFLAGSVSHRQRSWDSPFGGFPSRKVAEASPLRLDPHYRFPCRSSRCRSTEPARQAAVPGSCPFRESLVPARGFNPSGTGSSLGLPLLGYSGDCLDRAFTRSPLTRFADPTTNARAHRRLRVSISPRLGLPVHRT
jgi:hypothetical protein